MNQENEVLLIWEGKEYRFPQGTVYRDVANSLLFDEDVLLVLENNHLRELHHRAKSGSEIKLLTYADKAGAKAYQRSLFLLLCAAVNKLHGCDPDYLISVHFVAGNGLYCTLQDSSKVTSEFLKEAESVMRSLVDAAVPIRKYLVPTDEAVKVFRTNNMRDKERLFKYRRNSRTNLYELDGYRDYYYGYMVDNTRLLSSFSLDQYDTGFILHYPQSRSTHLNGYALPDSKLFNVQKSSEEWCEKIRMRNIGDLNDCIVSGEITSVIRSQEAFQEMKISKIASLIAADKRKKIIMIAGPSSSGRTSFSHRLTTQLTVHGLTPHPIPVDDYFLDREKTPRHPDGTYNFECLEAIDIRQFNEDMTGLLQGKEVELPTFNFKTGKREYKGSCLKLQPDDVLVIEGIHCLNDQLSFSLPHENKFKIYISALTQLRVDEHNRIPTTDGRLLRRLVRDARTRGTKAEGTIGMWPSVRAGEENYIFPYQESADVMFNSALAYELAVLKIFAEPLLFGIPRDDPAHVEAKRLLKFLDYVLPISPEQIPADSLIREFIGGSCFPV